jgi:hypothetical protein
LRRPPRPRGRDATASATGEGLRFILHLIRDVRHWLNYRLVFVVLLVAAGLSAFALLTLRCPSCEKLVTNRSIGFGRVAVQIPLGLPERVCSKCGHDLRGSAKRASPEIQ